MLRFLLVILVMLSYVQKVGEVLTGINRRLEKNAKICFVDYDKFFDIIPNIEWLSNDKKINRIFKSHGFDVVIQREQGFAWKYVYIYGHKVKNV